MPETSINKNGHTILWEHKVWLAEEWIISSPIRDSILTKYFEGQLGAFVSTALNFGHDLGTL